MYMTSIDFIKLDRFGTLDTSDMEYDPDFGCNGCGKKFKNFKLSDNHPVQVALIECKNCGEQHIVEYAPEDIEMLENLEDAVWLS